MRVTFPRVTRAEWTKLSALRSTWVVLGLMVVLTVGLAGAAGRHARVAHLGDAFLGVDVFSLLLGVFGILMITGEYGSGLIRATFAAVPRRVPVLAAKAVVLALVSLPVMAVACLGALGADRVGEHVVRYVPVAAAQGMYAVHNPFQMLAPGPAALVLLAWVAAALAAGGLVLWRRDP